MEDCNKVLERKIKAYEVVENCSGRTMIAFARTAGKARSYAYLFHDDWFYPEYTEYSDFLKATSVKRVRELDASYRGHACMKWDDSQDRVDLVKKLNWACLTEDELDCEGCPATEYCERYPEYLEYLEEIKTIEELNQT